MQPKRKAKGHIELTPIDLLIPFDFCTLRLGVMNCCNKSFKF